MKIVLITGGPCVGKTAATEILFRRTPRSGWIDGDAGHRINPFVADARTIGIGYDNLAAQIRGYRKFDLDWLFVSWVLPEDRAVEHLKSLAGVQDEPVHDIVLYCTPEELNRRKFVRDGDGDDYGWVAKSLKKINAIKIDTTHKEPARVAQEIATHLGIKMEEVQHAVAGYASQARQS
jgi:hypothetical protein